jgi:chromate transporter
VRPESTRHPSFGEAFLFWLKLGFISFGGPTGQIAIMHAELVEKKKWISEARFLHALNYCMLLPGPEAQQLATYVGWLLHKTWGGIVAGAFFVIPSIFILWGLSYIYVTLGNLPWIAAIFCGLKPAVLAIVAAAVIRIGSRALKNEVMWTLAAAAFIAWSFDHRYAICWLSRRLEQSRPVTTNSIGHSWRFGDDLGYVCALFSVDLPGWSLH